MSRYEARDASTIYIPTKGRTGRQTTWRHLPEYWRARAFIVSPPDEVDALKSHYPGALVLPCPAKGISATRQWILDQHDPDILGPTVIMLDDDLSFARRGEDDPGKFRQVAPQSVEFSEMMDRFINMLQYVPIGGITNRSGSNRNHEPFQINARLFDVMGLNLDVIREEGFRYRLRFMEDFDLHLQFLTAGYPSMLLNTFTKGDPGSNLEGGCSLYRDAYGQAEAAYGLHENFPSLVTVTERPGWSGMGEHRTDVRVAWKRAFEAGCAARDVLGRAQHPLPVWEADGTLRYERGQR